MMETGGLIHASNARDGIKHSSNAKYRRIVAVRRFADDSPGGASNTSATANSNANPNAPQGVVRESGDGYNEKYTSSAGITYTHYKQFQGSYAETPYWGGTIHHSGCGPTSIAIIASGLTNNNYTPKDIASHMSMTSYETLKNEMNSIGLQSEVIQSPSAQQIQDNLTNGKVMLVSVNGNTQFTSGSHIMALVDIDTSGKVYVCNPGSSTKYGWYDINEITRGCNYIVVTNAGAPAGATMGGSSDYSVQIATWSQVDTAISSNDPEGENSSSTQYSMTTTTVDYKTMVQPYTMPFEYLWALLVVGEEKNFVFDLADLVYGSDIQITVHDNLTIDTDIDVKHYTEQVKAEVRADIWVTCSCNGGGEGGSCECVHDPHSETEYTTTTKTITKTNTVDVALTRANVWIVDYKNEYTYSEPSTSRSNSTTTEDDTSYGRTPSSTGDSYSCEHINAEIARAQNGLYHEQDDERNTYTHNISTDNRISVKYYRRTVNIHHDLTNIVETMKYTPGTPDIKEKTDKETAPNFVTIFNDNSNKLNKSRLKDASQWLFEILETNPGTSNMLDLTKYLFFKAGAGNYGVETLDLTAFYPGQLSSVGSVGANGYVVHIERSSSSIVINDVETLKRAFRGYSRSEKLIEHAQEYLDYQNQYKVNAVFAAAVAINETGGGRTGHAVDGKNNWYGHKDGTGGYKTFSSPGESIKAFYENIANGSYYFRQNKFDVHDIGMTYCENADAPGGWIECVNAFMTQMFNAVGIDLTSASQPAQSGTSNNNSLVTSSNASTQKLIDKLNEISAFIKQNSSHCKKSGSITSTFAKAKELSRKGSNFKINCAAPIQWALQDIGLIERGGSFYSKWFSSPRFSMSNSSRQKLSSKAQIMNSNGKKLKKAADDGTIVPGDIICIKIEGYSGTPHTIVYAGKDSSGKIQAYEGGGNAKNKGYGRVGCGPFDYSKWQNKYKVMGIIRIK